MSTIFQFTHTLTVSDGTMSRGYAEIDAVLEIEAIGPHPDDGFRILAVGVEANDGTRVWPPSLHPLIKELRQSKAFNGEDLIDALAEDGAWPGCM